MKSSDIQKLKEMSQPEMQETLQEKRDKLWELKRDLAAGKVKNVREIHDVKKTIARLLTFMRVNSQ